MQQIIVIIIARCVWAGTIGCINLYSLPFSLNLWTFLVLSILPRVIDCRVILCKGGDEVGVVGGKQKWLATTGGGDYSRVNKSGKGLERCCPCALIQDLF